MEQHNKDLIKSLNYAISLSGNSRQLDTHDVLIWANNFYYNMILWLNERLNKMKYDSQHIDIIMGNLVNVKLNIEKALLNPDCSKEEWLAVLANCTKLTKGTNNKIEELAEIIEMFAKCEEFYRQIRNKITGHYNNYISMAITYNYTVVCLIKQYYNNPRLQTVEIKKVTEAMNILIKKNKPPSAE